MKHSDRVVVAVPAPAGRKPSWGGFVPQFLGYEVCRRMADLLTSDAPLPYLDLESQRSLETMRLELGAMLRQRTFAHEIAPDGELLWTFAGGAVNQTLKYGLAVLRGWNAAADNFRLRLPSDDVTLRALEEALSTLRDPAFWHDSQTEARFLEMLPEYRLSKFQRALPRRFSLEMVKDYLLDIPATLRFLA